MLSTDTQYCWFGSFCVSNPPRWNWDSDVAAYGNSARGWYIMGDVLGVCEIWFVVFFESHQNVSKMQLWTCVYPGSIMKITGKISVKTGNRGQEVFFHWCWTLPCMVSLSRGLEAGTRWRCEELWFLAPESKTEDGDHNCVFTWNDFGAKSLSPRLNLCIDSNSIGYASSMILAVWSWIMITLFMVLLMTKWADISGESDFFFQNLSKISHFASLPSKQTSLNSEVGFISQRNLQGCYDRQGISTVRLGNSDNWQHHVCFAPTVVEDYAICLTTSTQLEQIPRAYWILLDPMMRYGDIDVSPLFWGSEVGDAWERWTAGRRSLHADPVSWKNGFGWLWDIPHWRCDAAHACTYMGHGSTWIYMDVHGNFPNLMFWYGETLMPDLRTRHATCESKDVSSQSETRCCDIVGNFTIWRSDKWS